MKFRLKRQDIDSKIINLGLKQIRKNKIYVPKAPMKLLKELARVATEIQETGLPKHLVLKKLQKPLGFGIFLSADAKPIEKGSLIAPYSGKVCVLPQHQDVNNSDYTFSLILDIHLTKEEQKEWDPKNRYHPKRLYSIDLEAQKVGNFTRFINHSGKHPNLEAKFLKVPQNDLGLEASPFEVFYVARKQILPGEQLLICYDGDDDSYWGALKIKPFPMTPKTFKINASGELYTNSRSRR
jgi:hypothetical protein